MTAKRHEREELRNRYPVFEDRGEAGRVLAEMLASAYEDAPDTLVFAIPAGGVPVGLELSQRLHLPLDLMIVRKIQIPGNTEAGFGAVSLEGHIFLNQELLARLKLTASQIEAQTQLVKQELEERNRLFRAGKPLPLLSGKTVILVDDGLASGYTMMAAIRTLSDKGAQRIVVGVPTAPLRTVIRLEPLVQELYCPNIRETAYFAVADAYKNWHDVSRDEVLDLLRKPRN